MADRKKADVTEKLKSVIGSEMAYCIGLEGGTLSEDRATLKARYLGLPYGVDKDRKKDGWSVYIDRTVMEAVEWAKPGLMRVFASGEEIVRFEPARPEEAQAAKDATDYVNQIVFQPNAYSLVHDPLTDGLMQRVGWAKVWYEDTEDDVAHEYEGLTREDAALLLLDHPDATNVKLEEHTDSNSDTVCLRFKVKKKVCGVRVDAIPSENVIISQDARNIENARFIAHWELRMAGDLLKDGYTQEQIDELPDEGTEATDDYKETRIQRELNVSSAGAPETEDRSTRKVKIYEAWLFADIDGDGKPERVKAVYGGDQASPIVLDYEEWTMPRPPIFAACPVPMPHSVIGLSLADLVVDQQDLRSELTRNMLDNLYLANQGELLANEGSNGSVDMDQLLSRRAGGVYKTTGDARVEPLPVISTSGEALAALAMTDKVKEARTGIGQNMQGVQADALQNTATGASIQEEAINQRNELIARNYAENFFKPMSTYILRLLGRYHDRDAEIMLKGRALATRPSQWSPDMSVRVSVALGTGSRTKQASALQLIMGVQQQAMTTLGPASPVKLRHVMHTAKRLAACLGFQDGDAFFGSDEDALRAEQQMLAQQQLPQNDPNQALVEIEKAKAEAQMRIAEINQQIKAMELEAKKNEGAARVMTDAQADERKHQLEVERLQANMLAERAKAEAQLEIERAKLAILERKAALEMALAEMKANNDAALDGRRLEIERELKLMTPQIAAPMGGQEGF